MKKLRFDCARLPVLGESKDFMSAENIDLEQFRQMVDIFHTAAGAGIGCECGIELLPSPEAAAA